MRIYIFHFFGQFNMAAANKTWITDSQTNGNSRTAQLQIGTNSLSQSNLDSFNNMTIPMYNKKLEQLEEVPFILNFTELSPQALALRLTRNPLIISLMNYMKKYLFYYLEW